MMRKSLLFLISTAALSIPATAAAPPFDTPARVAFMIDLSSGAVLYDKNGDVRMPPASMAKMMTVHIAFNMIKRGEHKLNEICQVRPETWQKWHGTEAGSTMFLSPGEQVSVQDLLHGIVTLSGNDASVVLAECFAGTEPAFAALMNQEAQATRNDQQPFRQFERLAGQGVTYVTARDLTRLAGRRSGPRPTSTRPSTPRRRSPTARRWAATSRSSRAIAIPCSAISPAPTGSRPATPRKRASASPGRPSRTAAASSW
jgi:D-alanyl-D-alanine carboxypeptidase (penicillin-binding protein 5/6)